MIQSGKLPSDEEVNGSYGGLCQMRVDFHLVNRHSYLMHNYFCLSAGENF